MNLPIPGTMDQARVNILQQGIQQINRYAILYPKLSNTLLYPYSVVLPGLGYDFIDHSIWSIPRKIPFRKTFTDLEITFITGKKNYRNMINFWSSMITNPKTGSQNGGGALSTTLASSNFAQANGISTSSMQNLSLDPGLDPVTSPTGSPPTSLERTGEEFGDPDEQLEGGEGIPGIPGIPGLNYTNNIQSENIKGYIKGFGGAANYMDDIYSDSLELFLLPEDKDGVDGTAAPNATILFEEVYVSQIAPVQLTSIETGYSPFKVFFKFAALRAI